MNWHRIAESFETFLRKKEFLKIVFKKKWASANSLEVMQVENWLSLV